MRTLLIIFLVTMGIAVDPVRGSSVESIGSVEDAFNGTMMISSQTCPRVAVIGASQKQAKNYMRIMGTRWQVAACVAPVIPSDLSIHESSYFQTIEDVPLDKYDFALVCAPHSRHRATTEYLATRGKPCIKDVPLALSVEDFDILESPETFIFVAAPRPFNPCLRWAMAQLLSLGRIFHFSYDYTVNSPAATSLSTSYGGVVMEMGYHVFDVLTHFFPYPKELHAAFGYCYDETRRAESEDSASIVYQAQQNNICGHISLNRHSGVDIEIFKIYGKHAQLHITPAKAAVINRQGQTISEFEYKDPLDNIIRDMFCAYMDNLDNHEYYHKHLEHHKLVTSCIERLYELKPWRTTTPSRSVAGSFISK